MRYVYGFVPREAGSDLVRPIPECCRGIFLVESTVESETSHSLAYFLMLEWARKPSRRRNRPDVLRSQDQFVRMSRLTSIYP